ncbi:MAG: response regulator [Acidimicrobiales bacterium]
MTIGKAAAGVATRRVLFIDDNPANVLLFERIVRQRSDLEAVSCATGRSGLQTLKSTPIDLVFLDVHLPDMSGTDVLAEIRDDTAAALTKVVMVTADLDVRASDFSDDPFTSFFAKPMDVHRMLHLLETELPADAAG